jgi:hypothetical protein
MTVRSSDSQQDRAANRYQFWLITVTVRSDLLLSRLR